MSLFWHLECEAGKEYSQLVEHTFRLTNVCIAASDSNQTQASTTSSLMVKTSPSIDDIEADEKDEDAL